MQTIVLLHGIWSSGKHDVERMRAAFESAGFNVILFDDKVKGFFASTFGNDRDAKRLARVAPVGSTVVGHSNAAVVIQRASTKHGAMFKQAVLISPALDNEAVFGPNLERVIVLYSKYDLAVQFAQWIPFHPYGNMGAVGYKGTDRRVESYDKMGDFEMKSWSHFADLFYDDEKLEYFTNWIIAKLQESSPPVG